MSPRAMMPGGNGMTGRDAALAQLARLLAVSAALQYGGPWQPSALPRPDDEAAARAGQVGVDPHGDDVDGPGRAHHHGLDDAA